MNASARTATVTWRDDGSTSELSVYQLQLHPDFAFAIGDVVLKLPPPAGSTAQDGAAAGAAAAAAAPAAAAGAADSTHDGRDTAGRVDSTTGGAGSGRTSAAAAAGGAEGEGTQEQAAKAPGKGPAAAAGRGAPMPTSRILKRRCSACRFTLK